MNLDDADASFDVIFSLVVNHVGKKDAMAALARYSTKSRSVALKKVSMSITSVTECLQEAKAIRDNLEAEDNAAEDILAAQSTTINGYIRRRSHLKMRYEALKADRK